MARTKASVGAKVSSGKSNKARCNVAPVSTPSTSGTSEKSSRSYTGGNPVCPRETPNWQKPITNFFVPSAGNSAGSSSDDDDDINAATSKSNPKRNIIQSDDENEDVEPPKNQALDESFDLEPLNGENCRKLDEYYTNKDKGKGKKSTKNKENLDLNGNQSSGKRQLEETDETESASKKVKIS